MDAPLALNNMVNPIQIKIFYGSKRKISMSPTLCRQTGVAGLYALFGLC